MENEVREIFGLAYRISTETKTDVMTHYYGHVDSLDIDVYIDGFDEDKDSNRYSVSLEREHFENEITAAAAIKLLKELLKRG